MSATGISIDQNDDGTPHLRKRQQMRERLMSLALFTLMVGIWHIVVRLFHVPQIIFPSPGEVLTWLIQGVSLPISSPASLVYNLGFTAFEAVLGFLLGGMFGVLSGFALAHWSSIGRVCQPYIQAFNALPKVAIAPLMVVWLGYGSEPKITMAAILVFFPMMVSCIAGYNSVDPDRIDLARSCGASKYQIFSKIIVPSSMPFMFAGLHVAIVLAMLGAIVGEFVGATAGLGVLLLQYNNNLQVGGVFAVLIVLGAVGFGLSVLVQKIEDRVCFWSKRTKNFGEV